MNRCPRKNGIIEILKDRDSEVKSEQEHYIVLMRFFIQAVCSFIAVASACLLLRGPPAVDAVSLDFHSKIDPSDGHANIEEGKKLLDALEYDKAAMHFWRAILVQEKFKGTPKEYGVEGVFQSFMQCWANQGKVADGFVFIAQESIQRGQASMGKEYVRQALAMDPDHSDALLLQAQLDAMGLGANLDALKGEDTQDDGEDSDQFEDTAADNNPWGAGFDGTPEQLYEKGATFFATKEYEKCADTFEVSCLKSNKLLGPSCTNAVYCRNLIVDWGFNGTQFDADMELIERIAKLETSQNRVSLKDGTFQWKRATSPHPHMMLGYPVDPMLKRYVAEAAAFMEDIMSRVDSKTGQLKPLPADLPFKPHDHLLDYIAESQKPGFKLKIGFVASGFNSKAVLYLSHDMFRFFDKEKFEVHVFSMGPPDNPMFIQHGMRGVDWRERVKANVDYFHDARDYKDDHIALARFIKQHNIHVLLEWDGYARQGERAQGLFALRAAPIQIWHQEYLGTSGALYVDYIFTDKISSPPHLDTLYTEKLIWMPNHFFSKGHAMQKEVKVPTYDYTPKQVPYVPGSGNPHTNRCMAAQDKGPELPSFVFCNFNKFLKTNPQTIRSWVRILREVPDSMLCLLENPDIGVAYMRKFIHETAGTSIGNADEDSFIAGDGDDLNARIHFLPWQKNPFDHQMRNQDFCHLMLDSYPYNGHTTAQDSLYGGVPIVTRSDGDDMSSRVTTSGNIVLGLEQLNAYGGPSEYEDIAIDIANDPEKYSAIRNKLIATALQRNPMHPYWDVPRYVKNFQTGLMTAWERFLSGQPPEHITVEESEETSRGTYDDVVLANPPEGKKAMAQKSNDEL